MGKGDSFERDICRTLSLWWTSGDDPDVFWRNRLRGTKHSPNAKNQLGDIAAMKSIGAPLTDSFSIEIKTGYSKTKTGTRTKNIPWDLLDIIDGNGKGKKTLLEFWKQCETDAELSRRSPMLIFKRDFHQPVICLESYTVKRLEELCGELLIEYITLSRFCDTDPQILRMYRLEIFLNRIDPEMMRLFSLAQLKGTRRRQYNRL